MNRIDHINIWILPKNMIWLIIIVNLGLNSVSETADWDNFHSVFSGISNFPSCENNQQIRFSKSDLLLRLIFLGNKAFDFKEVFCAILI